MQLEKSVAIVTGASHGIGLAIARALLQEGCRVAAFARSQGELPALREAFAQRLLTLCVDVSDPMQVRKGVGLAAERFGGLDILINNAGVSVSERSPVERCNLPECTQVVNTNLLGTFYMCHAALPYLKQRETGYIINLLSTVAYTSSPGKSIYTASKFGQRGFTDAIIKETRASSVRVSSISPGGTDTNIWNLKKTPPTPEERSAMLRPEDVANAALFLLKQPDYVHIEDIKITSWYSVI